MRCSRRTGVWRQKGPGRIDELELGWVLCGVEESKTTALLGARPRMTYLRGLQGPQMAPEGITSRWRQQQRVDGAVYGAARRAFSRYCSRNFSVQGSNVDSFAHVNDAKCVSIRKALTCSCWG